MSSGLIFAIIVVAIITVGRIVRAGMELEARKHGFSLKDRRGSQPDTPDHAFAAENAALRSKVARLEDRTAVLERIATDAPDRLTAEIEKLRD